MWGWNKYVPVSTRIANAKVEMNKLRKKGTKIEPVEIQGRTIAKKFWGKRWCEHLEKFSDFSNRLPRGRTYTRNGSVCHLGIKKGHIEAYVSGSSLYNVKVNITTLKETKWKAIKEKCSGQIGSLLELLKGKLSDNVMEVVADHKEGLFPNDDEMRFSCDCPDWAGMCKHVAAVLYGIGNRLDEQPDLLFLLRDVDASELIATKLTTDTAKSDDLLDDDGLSDLFGIDLDDVAESTPTKKKKNIKKPAKKVIKAKKKPKKKSSINPKEMTGRQLQKIRMEMNLTVGEFADALEVTPASIYRWEKMSGILNLRDRSANAIALLLE